MVYTIKKLARLAGVTTRTLHYYDEIGLLKPQTVGDNGYRYYGEEEALLLQQILFFRELDFPLAEIQRILGASSFDEVAALEHHHKLLQAKKKRLERLIKTLARTIAHKKGDRMLTDEELYEGFTKEEIEEMKREVREKYDPKLVAQANARVRGWSKSELENIKNEGQAITVAISEQMDKPADSPEVQALIAEHHQHMNRFYDCSIEIYRGLGELYVTDPRFTAYYEKVKPGLAEFMHKAMTIYAERIAK